MIINQKLAKKNFLTVYFNNLELIRKPDILLKGYLARRFEVQIPCQNRNYLKY